MIEFYLNSKLNVKIMGNYFDITNSKDSKTMISLQQIFINIHPSTISISIYFMVHNFYINLFIPRFVLIVIIVSSINNYASKENPTQNQIRFDG